MNSPSAINAKVVKYDDRSENQYERLDLFVKVVFTTIPNINEALNDDGDRDMNVAEQLVFREERNAIPVGDILFEGNHVTITVLCDDLICNETGHCNDPEGLYLKVLEAINETFQFLENKDDVIFANVHFILYSFEFCEDALRGFAYLINNEESLNCIDEKYISYILNTEDPFIEWREKSWFLFVDYIGIFEYYQLFSPILKGSISIDECDEDNKPLRENKVSRTASDKINTQKQDIVAESENNGVESPYSEEESGSTKLLEGYVRTYQYVGDWIEDTQTVLEVLSCFPAVGEISSLVNGFIYLGRELKACNEWDDAMVEEMQKKAIESFIGAIPGSSIIKGTVKLYKSAKAVKAAINAEKAVINTKKAIINAEKAVINAEEAVKSSTKGVKKSQQALNRIRNKKTTARKQNKAKTNHKEKTHTLKQHKFDLKSAIKDHNEKIQTLKQYEFDLESAVKERTQMLSESGLSIGELNNLSKCILKHPVEFWRKTMKVTDKNILQQIPTTVDDVVIDAMYEGSKHIKNALDSFHKGDYETGQKEFYKFSLDCAFNLVKLQNLELSTTLDTINKLYDKSDDLKNKYSKKR